MSEYENRAHVLRANISLIARAKALHCLSRIESAETIAQVIKLGDTRYVVLKRRGHIAVYYLAPFERTLRKARTTPRSLHL